jgi:electron transport complex protein RnfB
MNETGRVAHIIIPPQKASEILTQVGVIYLRDCICRVRARNCPPEYWEVCLLFDGASEDDLAEATIIPLERAQALLAQTARRGVIYTLFYTELDQALTELCSCCTCCCAPLRKIVDEGHYDEYLRSGYVATTDPEICLACGSCEPACPFGARWVEDSTLKFAEIRCFGCGRCVTVCPEAAIQLERQPGRGVPIPGLET